MGAILRIFKSAVDWSGTVYAILGWFGLSSIVTGTAAAVAGTVWAGLIGVPLPIALLAGLCTVVAVLYLGLFPLAIRALRRIETSIVAGELPKPNYAVWKYVEVMTLIEASRLFADIDPHAVLPTGEDLAARGWEKVIKSAAMTQELKLISGTYPNKNTVPPSAFARTTRSHLKEWATKNNWSPRFLED